MDSLKALLVHPVVAGAISGFTSAALVDYAAFRQWKSLSDAANYDWGVAAWRWFQGAVGGALAALGIAAVA